MFKGRHSTDILFLFALVALIKNINDHNPIIKLDKKTNPEIIINKKEAITILKPKKYNSLDEIITSLQKSIFTTKLALQKNKNLDPNFLKQLDKINFKIINAHKRYHKKDAELFVLGPISALAPSIKERELEKRLIKLATDVIELLCKLTDLEVTKLPKSLTGLTTLCNELAKIYLSNSVTKKLSISTTAQNW